MNIQSARRLIEKYGGLLEVERRGRCSLCGQWIDDRTVLHGSFGDASFCKGTKSRRWTYKRFVTVGGQMMDAKPFTEYADELSRLEAQARAEQRSLLRCVPVGREEEK